MNREVGFPRFEVGMGMNRKAVDVLRVACEVNSRSDEPIRIPHHLQATIHYLVRRGIDHKNGVERRKC